MLKSFTQVDSVVTYLLVGIPIISRYTLPRQTKRKSHFMRIRVLSNPSAQVQPRPKYQLSCVVAKIKKVLRLWRILILTRRFCMQPGTHRRTVLQLQLLTICSYSVSCNGWKVGHTAHSAHRSATAVGRRSSLLRKCETLTSCYWFSCVTQLRRDMCNALEPADAI